MVPTSVAGLTPVTQSVGPHRPLALGLMMGSGFAALGYQIVWTQQAALWLGHESAAVFAVVAAFFGGLSLGALMLGPRIDRSAHPARWYATCEAVIGLWSAALALLMTSVTGWLLDLTGAQPSPAWQWAVAFCGIFLLLLPATAAMGATLPAMERALTQGHHRGSSIAAVYAGNTFGAVLGVLAAAFWLVPEFGLVRTAAVCMVLNLLCAAVALKLFAGPITVALTSTSTSASTSTKSVSPYVLPLLAATGLLGIGYEVLVVRVLSQVAENTVYTFAILLAVYLVGTALGAAAYQRWLSDTSDPERLRDRLLRALAAACLIGTLSLAGAQTIKEAMLQVLEPSLTAALLAEAALAITAFLLPTIIMGALFSHLCTMARAGGIGFGRALGVNTLGATAAPLVFGLLLVPGLGPRVALVLVAAGYLILSMSAMRRKGLTPTFWVTGAATLALSIWAPALTFVEAPQGGRIISHHEGAMAAVSIVEDANGVAFLHINNRQAEGSSGTLLADARQALLPLLLHPAPRRALFLGLGTGVTA
ncbi:MAG: spermidine synthase, partial [Burkholderiales bacterium]